VVDLTSLLLDYLLLPVSLGSLINVICNCTHLLSLACGQSVFKRRLKPKRVAAIVIITANEKESQNEPITSREIFEELVADRYIKQH